MKKGFIYYWLGETPEAIKSLPDMSTDLVGGADEICHAESEFEMSYAWWRLIARGMQEVSCVKVHYDDVTRKVGVLGHPMRLSG